MYIEREREKEREREREIDRGKEIHTRRGGRKAGWRVVGLVD